MLENSRGNSRAKSSTTSTTPTTTTLKPDSSRNEIHYNGRQHRKTTTLGVTREVITSSTESAFQSNFRSRQRHTTAATKDNVGNNEEVSENKVKIQNTKTNSSNFRLIFKILN